MIERTARRRDDHVDTTLERADLRLHRRPAVDRHRDRAERLAVAVDRLGDLHREFARRHEHECGGAFARRCVEVEAVQQREREGGGLAGAGRGLGQHIAAGEQRRDRGHLDRRRLLVSQRGQRGDDFGMELERGEPRRGCFSGGACGHPLKIHLPGPLTLITHTGRTPLGVRPVSCHPPIRPRGAPRAAAAACARGSRSSACSPRPTA